MRTIKASILFFLIIPGLFLNGFLSYGKSGVNNSKQYVVVIDPGHGGKDPGAVNKSIREKDIVLGVGLKLGKLIADSHSDVKVVYTRSTDVFVPLIERSRFANKNKADLFISIHANHCGTPSVRGTETFVLGLHRSNDNLEVAKKENSVILLEEDYRTTYEGFDPNLSESYIMFELVQDIYMDKSLSFADDVQQQFKSNFDRNSRGVKQAGFLVLRQTSMPSVLVEAGFLSNTTEANFMNSQQGQQQIAQSIFEAFRKYKNKNWGTSPQGNQDLLASTEKVTSEVKKEEQAAVTTTETSYKIPAQSVVAEKSGNEPINNDSVSKEKKSSGNIFYRVQIGANTTPVEPVAANFKGLKNVQRDKIDKYYRYYIGNEDSIEKATALLNQIKQKYPQAFIVSFVDGKRVPLN
jgi:N-acetylmuramoyl-L-alanine amidase